MSMDFDSSALVHRFRIKTCELWARKGMLLIGMAESVAFTSAFKIEL